MKNRGLALGGLAAAALACWPSAAVAADSRLDAFRVEATAKNLGALKAAGFDVTEGRNAERGTIDVVGTPAQVRGTKVDATRVRDAQGRSSHDRSLRNHAATHGADDSAYDVWTKYDAVPDDDKEQYTEQYDRLVAENPGLVARRSWGTTINGRDIVGLQVTKGATGSDIPGRPAVLYNAMQHAREWLAGETCRRTLEWFVGNYGKTTSAGRRATQLVDENELWFVCVNNPDGYEFTFTPGNRLWRKNLRDNNGDGRITTGDGVDPNRNFSSHWGLDDEGSSPNPASETYRGPSPASEEETKAMERLFAEIRPVFQKNDHTAAELLLYPQGFQQDTPTADHEIFTALAGDPFEPGIPGFLPELSAGLYITNGDFTDWAYTIAKTLSFTPEGTAAEDPNVTGFEYADSRLQVRQEFDRHLPFALDLATFAKDPANSTSHLDRTPRDFVVQEFATSHGDPQLVQATVKRGLGPVVMRYRINGGPTLEVDTTEFEGGERYFRDDDVFYHRVRGVVAGTDPGDRVEVWFAAGGRRSDAFTYSAVAETDAPVLLLSDEDWSGKQPNPAPLPGPQYLDTYRGVLDRLGVRYDVYDVSADRRAPDPLGVLSHYSHVVWYTGDDYVPREPDAPSGSGISKLAVDTQNRVRDFLNEGGKLFYTGSGAGQVFAEGYRYNPFQYEEGEYCPPGSTSEQCIFVQDDFLQYWLGAYSYLGGAGDNPDGGTYPVRGAAPPFEDRQYPLEESHTATLITMSSIYDAARYPQWAGARKVLSFDRPGAAPYDPHTGDWYMAAGYHDETYKRLLHSADLRGKTSARLSFQISHDLEADYDYAFVEIHTAGQDDWTTLADANGHTSDDTGLSCPSTGAGSNWQSLHPFLAHYQTKSSDGSSCTPTGTTGAWNAATGVSGGWQRWDLDIPARFLNREVEVSITVATDPAVQGLGLWVDDAVMTTDSGDAIPLTSFETDTGGWTAAPPPPGTVEQTNTWARAQSAGFVEGPGVATDDTVYTAFGLEKVEGDARRDALMRDALEHLGTARKPVLAAPVARVVDPPGQPSGPGGTPGTPGTPGAPGTPTGQAPATATAGLTLFRVGSQRLRRARIKGVRFRGRCSARCTVTVDLRVDRPTRRRLGVRSDLIGRRTLRMTTRTTTAHVRFFQRIARRLRSRSRVRVIVVASVHGRPVAGGRFIVSSRLR